MMDFPLLLSTLYDRSVWLHGDQQIVSVEHDLSVTRTTYGDTDVRVRQLATAMQSLGIEQGDAVGTFAWNNQRHHELYWATANTGRICHTLNIRLFPDQLIYIINHARDKVVFVDPQLAAALEPIADRLETVEKFVIMSDGPVETSLPHAVSYEDLISDQSPWGAWPELDERSPMMFCYTSGTTGNPKGVAYTQRSTYLHTISNMAAFPISSDDNILVIVPMFHAASWGYPFSAVTAGARLTYPGPDLSPDGVANLLANERITISPGVPTVWLGVKQYLEDFPDLDLSSVRALFAGGSAVPRALIDWYETEKGVEMVQGWGMTETNPVASIATVKPQLAGNSRDEILDVKETAGLVIPGLQVKIVDEDGNELPHDGVAFGELLIRGPWIAAEYYNDSRTPDSFEDGWLRTGDVCKITPDGYIRITDRAKDVIKSGGEWISSLDVENILMAHADVAEAAVVGVKHIKWQERPLALVVKRPESDPDEQMLLDYLDAKVASWWVPDRVVFIDEIPKTGTGKFDKKVLRDQYLDVLMGD